MEFTPEILAKLAPTAEGIPIYLDQRDPELEDPARKLAPHQWQPACNTTSKLTRCLEAVRDLSSAMASLKVAPQPEIEKRLVKQAIVPLYNLAITLRDLYNDVQSTRWTKLSKGQKEKLVKRFKRFCRSDSLFQLRHERRECGSECVADRPQLNEIKANLSPLHLAQVRLSLADTFGKLDLGEACGTPRLPKQLQQHLVFAGMDAFFHARACD